MDNFIAEVSFDHNKDTPEGDFSNVVNFYKNEILLPIYLTLLIKNQKKIVKNKSNS